MRICVLGAGISGLSTAFYLRSLSSNCHIDIFEKESSVGGKIKTCNRHGYKLEEGASSFLCNFDNDTDIFRMLEVEDQLLDKNIAAKSIFIYDGVNISKIPFTLSELFSSPLLGIFSKIRVALEILIPLKKTQHEESVQHFGYRRFGRDFTNKIIDAISSGLFASTAEKLCMNTTFPHIAKIESSFGSIIRNTYKHKQKTKLALKTFRNGMSSLIDALMKKVSSNIYVDTEICTINKIVNGWEIETCNGEKHRYDIVLLCTTSYVASRLLKNTDSDLAAILKKIEYSPISIVSLGYKNLPINIDDGYGIF